MSRMYTEPEIILPDVYILPSTELAKMHIGFLPYLPHPVTDHATVYTALRNFITLLSQLKQESLPVFCDEGVYRIVAEITLQNQVEFQKLVPLLGGFHMAKAAEHCIGKLVKGSGLDDTLVETKVFGVKVVEQVISGGHYERSLRAYLILEDVIEIMKWKVFSNKYSGSEALSNLKGFAGVFVSKDLEQINEMYENSLPSVALIKSEFDAFVLDCLQRSELCRFFEELLHSIRILKNLIAADRNGDWNGHLQAVQDLLPLFRECDSINYLRYASLYLEQMRNLEVSHPDVHAQFQLDHFVVKEKDGSFNAVSPDMRLEQSIQRSQKSSHGIIGQTRSQCFVTELEVVYHEVLSICNTFRSLTNSNLGSSEVLVHHELAGNFSKIYNEHVYSVLQFLESRGNPYTTSCNTNLFNFVTDAVILRSTAERLVSLYDHGKQAYIQFRTDRFIQRTSDLSLPIKKACLPSFSSTKTGKKARKYQNPTKTLK